MKDREATLAIRAQAERQHGVVARWQLDDLGLAKTLVQGRVEAGLLIPLFQGVFGLGHRRIDQKGEWMAAVLASGPGAVLSHGSALALWGVRGSRGPIEVLRRSGGVHRVRSPIRLHQTRCLDPVDTTIEAGIPVTTIERALLDTAGRLDDRQLERALVAADRSGRLRWPELERVLRCRRGRKGAGRLHRIASEVDPRAVEAKSDQEIDFLAICREEGVPVPSVNVLIEGHLVDFLWPRERVVVETDSYGYHADRPAFEHDHQVDVDLIAAGYAIHRATYNMLNRAQARRQFLANVRESLRARTASNSLPARGRI